MITELQLKALRQAPSDATHYLEYEDDEFSILKLNPTRFWFNEINKWVEAEPHSIRDNMHKAIALADLRKQVETEIDADEEQVDSIMVDIDSAEMNDGSGCTTRELVEFIQERGWMI